MEAEIAEQPDVIRHIVAMHGEIRASVARLLPSRLQGVALVGRGSSANALIYGRYALEIATRRPVTFVAPSVHSLYGVDVDYADHLAIAASQSGRTPEIVDAAARLRAGAAATVGVTADVQSPLASAVDLVLDLQTGRERAVPATKTFTAELAVLAMIAEAAGPVPWHPDQWHALADVLDDVVADPGPAWRTAAALGGVQRVATVGRGFLSSVAYEAALKLEETALIAATPYSAASFRHGPVAAAAADFPVVAFTANGPAGDDVAQLVDALRARGVPVVIIGPTPAADLPIPGDLTEALLVLPAAVRAQQLALAVAMHRGLDADAPHGLEKVTRT
jgi:glucosamine--fructose-6-phosphate aminotransferase (isomerizing)